MAFLSGAANAGGSESSSLALSSLASSVPSMLSAPNVPSVLSAPHVPTTNKSGDTPLMIRPAKIAKQTTLAPLFLKASGTTNSAHKQNLKSKKPKPKRTLTMVPEDNASEDETPVAGGKSSFQLDAEWWFDQHACKLVLPCTPTPNCPDHVQVVFAAKRVRGFRNLFHMLKMTGGAAVGSAKVCKKIVARQLALPPLLDKKKCSSEEQCEAHVKKVFHNIWLVTSYYPCKSKKREHNGAHQDDELVKFSDLVEFNNVKDLRLLMTDMCKSLTEQNATLRAFLLLTLDRAFRDLH